MSAADIVAAAREFADGMDVSLTEAGNARIHITRLAEMVEQLTTDLDARFEHSDHQSAKYYQRMRAAEKETRMRRSESADFERERDEAVALIDAAEKTIQTAAMHLEGVLQRLDSYSWHQHDRGFVDSTRTPAVDAYNNLTAYMEGKNR